MRGMYRNRRKIWYAKYLGKEEILNDDGDYTGNTRPLYGNPKKVFVNKSTTSGLTNNNISGKVVRHPYGNELDYNVTINPIPYGMSDIEEQDVLWIDTEPVINEDGSTDTPYDHIVTRISYALNWRAMQAVKVEVTPESSSIDDE